MQLEDTKLPDLCPDYRDYDTVNTNFLWSTNITRDTDCVGNVKESKWIEPTTFSFFLLWLVFIVLAIISIGAYKHSKDDTYHLKD